MAPALRSPSGRIPPPCRPLWPNAHSCSLSFSLSCQPLTPSHVWTAFVPFSLPRAHSLLYAWLASLRRSLNYPVFSCSLQGPDVPVGSLNYFTKHFCHSYSESHVTARHTVPFLFGSVQIRLLPGLTSVQPLLPSSPRCHRHINIYVLN